MLAVGENGLRHLLSDRLCEHAHGRHCVRDVFVRPVAAAPMEHRAQLQRIPTVVCAGTTAAAARPINGIRPAKIVIDLSAGAAQSGN